MEWLRRLFGGGGGDPVVTYGELEPGMICRVRGGDTYKVAAVEPDGVHVLLVDPDSSVSMDGTTVSMTGMHLPIGRSSWEAGRPRRVGREDVRPAELEGYEEWRAAGGGYF